MKAKKTSTTNVFPVLDSGYTTKGFFDISGKEGVKMVEELEELEINWDKVKKLLTDDQWRDLIKNSVESWMNGKNYSRNIEDLLKREGILATKRENSLDNLLKD